MVWLATEKVLGFLTGTGQSDRERSRLVDDAAMAQPVFMAWRNFDRTIDVPDMVGAYFRYCLPPC